LFQSETASIPEVDSEVVGRSSYQVLMLKKLQIEYLSFVGVDFVEQSCTVSVINFEP
jgi:hypothetical protein